jgi:hypothetical protein
MVRKIRKQFSQGDAERLEPEGLSFKEVPEHSRERVTVAQLYQPLRSCADELYDPPPLELPESGVYRGAAERSTFCECASCQCGPAKSQDSQKTDVCWRPENLVQRLQEKALTLFGPAHYAKLYTSLL